MSHGLVSRSATALKKTEKLKKHPGWVLLDRNLNQALLELLGHIINKESERDEEFMLFIKGLTPKQTKDVNKTTSTNPAPTHHNHVAIPSTLSEKESVKVDFCKERALASSQGLEKTGLFRHAYRENFSIDTDYAPCSEPWFK